ncbi:MULTISPECIES: excinuclease ABC subunit UvrA [unclassified Pseudoalteromonas]|uniref:excinuclease ABC subunit UvrA n=1 Tax=unclassified Pseudoalteromonas TaxID=194690 RepID=UPI000B716292|nr:MULTISPECIES: excinuclease ABC subunit UvrA [unclassified Pseudoalteromonas]MAJ40096.1 excinuclease ABC subunit A [Pseudoalteromonadaceae bacterium]OUX88496.1 MAG: excinuclease ABC subunit A [Pseudoalteromonas sp. TMED43]MDC9564936.1 excinuclease ABC subunit UvrA [Pseudoalteromonas sp. GAB2316C]MDC9569338.1 excinuclease ABC subunit UvrA [Pseudoalteromonas sp. GABNB9D]MDC9575549.1 excinuclease ABC subunit UvrA [Pseudoalteromonas sp. GABNS16A]
MATTPKNSHEVSNAQSALLNPEHSIQVRGARVHNLKNVDVNLPRNSLVVFTGISGSGKSSLAFGTLFAESQHRYLDSVSPYARRLIDQVDEPDVDSIEGLPPAVALQQQRGAPSVRSSVGSVTTISNALRMLYSRAGEYPKGQGILYADAFSPNTPQGACPECHGIGRVFNVTEELLVPDPTKSIKERAIAAWPPAWQGKNLSRILTSLGYDINKPWNTLPKKARDWILFTDDTPTVPVFPEYTLEQTQAAIKNEESPSYMGTFISAKRFVLQSFASTQSPRTKKRVSQYMQISQCPQCEGKKLKKESLSVKVAGLDIGEISQLTLGELAEKLSIAANNPAKSNAANPEKTIVAKRITSDIIKRVEALTKLGLGYLSLERTTPSLSAGELQRLRLATQIRSKLFGVVYVLDEPSAGLHPADTQALLSALDELIAAGNSVFVVEHDTSVIRHANWVVDVGPNAGSHGGNIVYSGPVEGLEQVINSHTSQHLFKHNNNAKPNHQTQRTPAAWLKLSGIERNNLHNISAEFPLGVITSVTGGSGSGKSSLVSQALVELIQDALGQKTPPPMPTDEADLLDQELQTPTHGKITEGLEHIKRLITVDQKAIGRTPRSNLATYTGLFDHVRKLFANTKEAKARKYDAGRFSFNVKKGRCDNCEGVGFVSIELLFLPSVYSPCPVCNAKRYNQKTLDITYKDKTIADVLNLTVESAHTFFADEPAILRALNALLQVGLGYLRLGQPATELSGGEAQRIKLATELQRAQRGDTLYILDEPTTGLHPKDVAMLMTQLNGLVDAGNTVIMVEHDMQVASNSDWVIDIGPGAGDEGGLIVAQGKPEDVAQSEHSRTATFLKAQFSV